MTLQKIKNNKKWDNFITKNLIDYSFFISSAKLQASQKINIIQKLGIYRNNQIIGIAPITYVRSKRGNAAELIHAPLLMPKYKHLYKKVLQLIIKYVKDNAPFKLTFIRFSPLAKKNTLKQTYQELKLVKAPIHNTTALITQYVDLTQPTEQILKSMHKNTRYEVKKALKDESISYHIYPSSITLDIHRIDFIKSQVIMVNNYKSVINIYKKLHKQTVAFKKYHDKPIDMIIHELDILRKNNMLYSVIAYKDQNPISVNIYVHYGKYLHYYLGANNTKNRKDNNASYANVFLGMLLGKAINAKYLDLFGGMVPDNCPNHPWEGIDLFKKRFGGKKVTYMHPYDKPLSIRYWLYYLYTYYETIKRGYTVNW